MSQSDKLCPSCGNSNPSFAKACACGYQFPGAVANSPVSQVPAADAPIPSIPAPSTTRKPTHPAVIVAIVVVGALIGVPTLIYMVKMWARDPDDMVRRIRPGESFSQLKSDFGSPDEIEDHAYMQFDICDYDTRKFTVKVFTSQQGVVQFVGKYPLDGSSRKSFSQL